MHWFDCFAKSLNKTVVVCVCAIDLGKRGSRENDIRKCSCLCFKEFLHDEEVELAKRTCGVIQMLSQKASSDVQRANGLASGLEQFGQGLAMHSHIERA